MRENNREESVVATTVKTEDIGKERQATKSEKQDRNKNKKRKDMQLHQQMPPVQSKIVMMKMPNQHQDEKLDPEILEMKKSIPNMIIIPDEKTGKPNILVNKRTGAVSKIMQTENHSIIKTTSIGTKSLYSIPLDVTKHLRFDECKIKHKNLESSRHLIDTIKAFPKNTKVSIFWSITQ